MSKLVQAVTVFMTGIVLFLFSVPPMDVKADVVNLYFDGHIDGVHKRNRGEVVTVEIPDLYLDESDISLIALVTMAEAESEPEYGQRLVIDTILNRVDSPYFPDTVSGVIYQKSQFSSMWNGRVDRCEVREDIHQLVSEELISRTDTDVIYFTAGHYGDYGKRMFSVGNHYFASYE